MLKSLAAYLPQRAQQGLKRIYWRRKIKQNDFSAGEPDFLALHQFLKPGDTTVDVGANVGQYTRRMAQLVGPLGWVISIEPMHETFDLLTSNCFDLRNVQLLKAAASNVPQEVSMDLPAAQGVANYYRASITRGGSRRARAITLDSLGLENVALLKIDAEGHDFEVLRGAERLINGCHPRIIIEADPAGPIPGWLMQHEYRIAHLHESPNLVAYHKATEAPVEAQGISDKQFQELERSAW